MGVFYWAGFVIGVALVVVPLAVAGLMLVPGIRRRWVTKPLLRRVLHRRPGEVAARTAELERDLSTLS